MSGAWWKDFFEGPVLDLWRAVASDEQAREEIDALMSLGLIRRGDRVLDVPCGDGRHLAALAGRGVRATGVDLSETFVNDARQRRTDPPIEVRRGDMRELDWNAEFDASLCLGNSFGYLEDAENRAFVESLARALRPGGRLVIQTSAIAESWFAGGPSSEVHQVGEVRVETESAYDPEGSRLHVDYLFGDGTRRRAIYRVYSVRDLAALLGDAGFVEVRFLGALPGDDFQEGDDEAWIMATRRA